MSDVPMSIRAETGGPGDDIALDLVDRGSAEIQCKKGLQRGAELWEALDALVDGIAKRAIDYGVLAITPDSSGTIRNFLAADIIKIGQGAEDSLSDIGAEWIKRLKETGRSSSHCANLRIQTLDLLESQGGDRRNVIDTLRTICADAERAEDALNLMYRDAIALMRARGRWTLPSLVTLLRSQGIRLREDNAPAGIATRLTKWTEATRGSFSLPAGSTTLPIEVMLPARLVAIPRVGPQAPGASAALDRYHGRAGEVLSDNVFDGQWTGRYRQYNVIIAGPGMGKSTLANRLAWEFARDGIPVLAVRLKRVAGAMDAGAPFELALEQHGLDGSGVQPAEIRYAQFARHVVVADGLDEAGRLHDQVAQGLVAYAAGHPQATIIVTTRPIGYETARLIEWRHYRLEPPVAKEGHKNLGRLLAATRSLDLADSGCLEEAKRELAATPVRDAIVGSPLLLGMSTTLIIQSERLPATKPELYEAMIALFEGRDYDAAAAQLTSSESARILDIIGWELTHNPLLTSQQLERAGCERLAIDLRQSALAIAPLFARGFAHWERAGIVERVHHAGTQLVTFVHKTFGEFAAARFLCQIGEGQQLELERLVDLAAFGEVVAFAGALGLGNQLAQLYVDRRGRGAEGQLERALSLAADFDAHVDDTKTAEIAQIALDIAATNSDDRFSIGKHLTALAKSRPTVVGPLARDRLDDPNQDVKLVAWAAAIEAGEIYYDGSRLEQALNEFIAQILGYKPAVTTGIRPNLLGRRIDLIQLVALATLKAKPVDEMANFVANNLSDRPFTSVGFFASVRVVLIANGIEPPASPLDFPLRGDLTPTAQVVIDPDRRWSRSFNRMMRALAIAVARDAPRSDATLSAKAGYPEFSALVELSNVNSTVASDILKWEQAYDEAAVAEAITGLVTASRINVSQLAIEAREILTRSEFEPPQSLSSLELTHPDIPAPDWRNAATAQLNRDHLEGAFSHGSIWLAAIAANLLAVIPSTEADCARLLEKARGVALFYAVQIAGLHTNKLVWRDLLLGRLQGGPDSGSEYILAALAESDVELVSSVDQTITAALRSEDDRVVEAAAKLGARWLATGGHIDTASAKSAYRNSRLREEAAKFGFPVTEVRAELLNLLGAAGSLDEAFLREAVTDKNTNVRDVAKRKARELGPKID
ncbi:NACHT domain-containing protein [Methylobacterium sp. A49B]